MLQNNHKRTTLFFYALLCLLSGPLKAATMQPGYPNIPTKQQALACGLHDLANVWGIKYVQTENIVSKYAQEQLDYNLDSIIRDGDGTRIINFFETMAEEVGDVDVDESVLFLDYLTQYITEKKFKASSKKAISIIENAVKKIQKTPMRDPKINDLRQKAMKLLFTTLASSCKKIEVGAEHPLNNCFRKVVDPSELDRLNDYIRTIINRYSLGYWNPGLKDVPLTSWNDYMPILVRLDYVKIVKKLDEHLKKNRIGHFITYCIKQNGDSLQSNSICVESSGSGSLAAGTQLVLTELAKNMLWQQFRHFVEECYIKMKTIMTCTPHKGSLTKPEVGLVLFGLLREARFDLTNTKLYIDALSPVLSYYQCARSPLIELGSFSFPHFNQCRYNTILYSTLDELLLGNVGGKGKKSMRYGLYNPITNTFKKVPEQLGQILKKEDISGTTQVTFHTMIADRNHKYNVLVFNRLVGSITENKKQAQQHDTLLYVYKPKEDALSSFKEISGLAFLHGVFIDDRHLMAWFIKTKADQRRQDDVFGLYKAELRMYNIPNNEMSLVITYPCVFHREKYHNRYMINDPVRILPGLFKLRKKREGSLLAFSPTTCMAFTYKQGKLQQGKIKNTLHADSYQHDLRYKAPFIRDNCNLAHYIIKRHKSGSGKVGAVDHAKEGSNFFYRFILLKKDEERIVVDRALLCLHAQHYYLQTSKPYNVFIPENEGNYMFCFFEKTTDAYSVVLGIFNVEEERVTMLNLDEVLPPQLADLIDD
ncbi:MAG: hypothetical protein AAF770_03650, partial [Bacteroidota bacterium]